LPVRWVMRTPTGARPWILLIIQVVIAAIGVAIAAGAYGRRRRGLLRR
jgi:hypothetical protein